MIVQSLYERYRQLLQDPKSNMSPPGYSSDKVSFVLVLSEDGEMRNIVDMRVQQRKKQVPIRMTVPEHTTRTSKPKPYFLSDKAEYILGIVLDKPAGFKISLAKFASSAELHKRLLKDCERPEARAVLRFYERWNPAELTEEHTLYGDLLKIIGTTDNNIVFQLEGVENYVHQNSDIQTLWSRENESTEANDDVVLGDCLVTGREQQPIAQVHRINIKGVRNAQQAGASMVSFNFPAVVSYGKIQSLNAPFSEEAAAGYAKALNHLLLSEHNRLRRMGDMTVVFWAQRLPGEKEEEWELQEGIFGEFFEGAWGKAGQADKESDEGAAGKAAAPEEAVGEENVELTRQIEDLLKRVKQAETVEANMLPAKDAMFYVLGMSGNNARLAVRFFWRDSFEQLFRKLSLYASDMAMERPGRSHPELPSLFNIMLQTVRQTGDMSGMRDSISGAMESEWFRAMLSGGALPYSVYAAVVNRTRVDGQMSPYGDSGRNAWIRASVIKAYLTRYARVHHQEKMKEALTPMLNEDAQPVAYRLGRLFAVLERAQTDAAGGPGRLNATIKDRYFGSASATPAAVFPILLRLSQHHMSKAEYGSFRDRDIAAILKGVDGFPNHLDLKQQGLFMLGYYHQVSYRAASAEKKGEKQSENGEGAGTEMMSENEDAVPNGTTLG
ncbi:type I-C CRISPR-associated protein Cas8c/Csd1 [Saccharibacillus alkalitolerans]|uniref:Type I-C CRISPR-associated protein Cas8c/Csd1 n=1 Tax=Saccharibacillus alkalitolerans TaxID=2705290 RepID=A0ABX0F1Y7_9BACL|nr:type I-C CRISPR-associated protein Cas8c/Csd1 [Saccharibacillus alkalitolerans]NGZ74049.1 type I-C CRISPR-associated protein Cas8c/Csd1 [Saccharibacillus alkalitolerans]